MPAESARPRWRPASFATCRATLIHQAAPLLREILTGNANAIPESDSVLVVVAPDVFLMAVDAACNDVKASSARFIHRADAFIVLHGRRGAPAFAQAGKPRFQVKPPDYVTPGVAGFAASMGWAAPSPGERMERSCAAAASSMPEARSSCS
jgi:hypothetical protein